MTDDVETPTVVDPSSDAVAPPPSGNGSGGADGGGAEPGPESEGASARPKRNIRAYESAFTRTSLYS